MERIEGNGGVDGGGFRGGGKSEESLRQVTRGALSVGLREDERG